MTLLFAPDCNHSNVIAAIVDGHFIQSFFVGMSGKGQIMFAGVGKNRLINGRNPAPVTDAESPQIFSGRKDHIPAIRGRRAIGEEGVVTGKIAFLKILCGDAASKAVIKMEEFLQAK